MEFGFLEYGLILVAAVSILGAAFTLAWIDASPRKSTEPQD
jgi:hypothetical protein